MQQASTDGCPQEELWLMTSTLIKPIKYLYRALKCGQWNYKYHVEVGMGSDSWLHFGSGFT